MSFLNPLFLFGLFAAAIPILIHLFTRRRPREVRFPSLEFLTEVNQSEIRRLRFKQWLLLLLRTLAVLAIALAMARPALKGTAGLKSGAATTIVALVDESGSMSAEAAAAGGGTAPAGTLAGQARRVVESLLQTMGPADELLLVPYDTAPHPVTPEPVGDLPRLRAAAQAFDAGAATTEHRAALEYAARALARSHSLNRELFWISDFQAAGFRADAAAAARPGDGDVAVPEGPWNESRIYLVPMVPRTRANVGIAAASLAPAEGGVALSVTAAAWGAAPGDLAVVARDGQGAEIGRGFLDVPESGETSTLLPLASVPDAGGVAEIPADGLALDDRRWFAAGRAGTQHIVLRDDDPASPVRFALEAGAPASGLEVDEAAAGGLAGHLDDADALVIDDVERLPANDLQALLDYHRAGGAVFIVLGDRADAAFWNENVLGQIGAGTVGGIARTAPGAAWRLIRRAAGHPVLAGFPARPGEPLSNARFQRVRAFTPAPGTRTLLEFDGAHPALVEGRDLLVFCASLGAEASDFPVSGAFLPLLHQAVKVLARGTASPSLVPGERYTAPASTGAWRIDGPGGAEVPSELTAAAGATRLVSDPLETARALSRHARRRAAQHVRGESRPVRVRPRGRERRRAARRVPARARAHHAPRRRSRHPRARGALRPRAVELVRRDRAPPADRRDDHRALGDAGRAAAERVSEESGPALAGPLCGHASTSRRALVVVLDFDALRQCVRILHRQHHATIAEQLLFVALLRFRARFAVAARRVVRRVELEVIEQIGAHGFRPRLAQPHVVGLAAAGVGVAFDLDLQHRELLQRLAGLVERGLRFGQQLRARRFEVHVLEPDPARRDQLALGLGLRRRHRLRPGLRLLDLLGDRRGGLRVLHRARTLVAAVLVDRHAGRRVRTLVEAVTDAVVVAVERTAVGVDRAAAGGRRAAVEAIEHAVAVVVAGRPAEARCGGITVGIVAPCGACHRGGEQKHREYCHQQSGLHCDLLAQGSAKHFRDHREI